MRIIAPFQGARDMPGILKHLGFHPKLDYPTPAGVVEKELGLKSDSVIEYPEGIR